jgi:hypothetical protein
MWVKAIRFKIFVINCNPLLKMTGHVVLKKYRTWFGVILMASDDCSYFRLHLPSFELIVFRRNLRFILRYHRSRLKKSRYVANGHDHTSRMQLSL